MNVFVTSQAGRWLLGAALVLGTLPRVQAQDDVADVPAQTLTAGGDAQKKFFLLGPKANTQKPEPGYGLIVVLPGDNGSAEFAPFVKRIFKFAVPEGYLVAQPVAVKWSGKDITWPTAKSKVPNMKFTTEEFVDAVVNDVAAKHKLDPTRIFTFSWSSGGPAAYAISLTSKKVTGSFIAMSVFKPGELSKLAASKGKSYYLHHSPGDRVCVFRNAEQANKQLAAAGARIKLNTYEGGHGWRGAIFDEMRQGIEWLESGAEGDNAKTNGTTE